MQYEQLCTLYSNLSSTHSHAPWPDWSKSASCGPEAGVTTNDCNCLSVVVVLTLGDSHVTVTDKDINPASFIGESIIFVLFGRRKFSNL